MKVATILKQFKRVLQAAKEHYIFSIIKYKIRPLVQNYEDIRDRAIPPKGHTAWSSHRSDKKASQQAPKFQIPSGECNKY